MAGDYMALLYKSQLPESMVSIAWSRGVGKYTEKREKHPLMKAQKKEPKAEVALDEEYLRMPEVAAIFNCSLTSAYRMATDGLIPSLRIGHMLRVPKGKLIAFIEAKTKDGTTAA
jgi:predicted DNA-binding transcriptional regulator AlpA